MAWDHCSRAGLSSLTMKLSPKPSNGILTETLCPFMNVDLSDSYAKHRDSSSSWQIKTWVNDNNFGCDVLLLLHDYTLHIYSDLKNPSWFW